MNHSTVNILIASFFLLSSFCYGVTITINTTIYDHSSTRNPDMENTDGKENPDRGVVNTVLGLDRKPMYIHGKSSTKTVHNATTFNTWFRNTEGLNVPLTWPMTLTKGSDGIYKFADCNFFPIDNKGFGNENRSHNYHFCLELHSSFTYLGNEVFWFSGDDDLWVFINNQLVIDLGGIHSAENQSIALNTLGLTKNHTYKFDLFFCERHVTGSTLHLQTGAKLFCDYTDRCGVCEGNGQSCSCSCDDGNPCTTDTCDIITGECSFSGPTECTGENNTKSGWASTASLVGVVVGGTAFAGVSVVGGKKAFDKYAARKKPQPATTDTGLFYKYALRKQQQSNPATPV